MNKVCMVKGFIEDIEELLNNVLVAPAATTFASTINAETGEEEFTSEASATKEALEKLEDLNVGKITKTPAKTEEVITGYTYKFAFLPKYEGMQGGNVQVTALGENVVLAVITAEASSENTESGEE